MPGNTKRKKGKNAVKIGQAKNLRQTTLFGSVAGSSPTRAQDRSSRQKTITPHKERDSEYSESSDIAAVKFEPITPAKGASNQDDRSQSPLPSRTRKRQRLVPETETETDEEYQSPRSDSGVRIKPNHRRLRRLAAKSSSSSREGSPSLTRFTSKEKAKKAALSTESDEELVDEVDEDRMSPPSPGNHSC